MDVDGLLLHVKIPVGKQCEFVQFAERYLHGYLKTIIDVKTFAPFEFDGNHRKTIRTVERPVVGIAQNNKQKEICPDGSDQLPVNKGDVPFTLDNMQAPSATSWPNYEDFHISFVVYERQNKVGRTRELSPNADIHAHADDDLPRPYAT
ncbi:hypothetical protein Tco_0266589, partial [Tanacetum coccineum]